MNRGATLLSQALVWHSGGGSIIIQRFGAEVEEVW